MKRFRSSASEMPDAKSVRPWKPPVWGQYIPEAGRVGLGSLSADRVNERSVACHVPYRNARPLPVLRFHIPPEGLAAERRSAVQIESLRECLRAVAPYDFSKGEREGPANTGRRRDG